MNVCPLLSIFDSTIDSLSHSEWLPKKDYQINRLNTSILGELASLSNLIIDETNMKEGKIEANGVENIKAIATLIED
jgi:Mini-chromosome maintenance replisome factor